MRGLIQYFIKYPIAANLLMIALFALGWFGLANIKSTFFPEVESRIISIQTIFPGAAPEEVEEGIINKIEENLKGLSGIERFVSVSRENSGTVTVEVLKGYDTDVVLQDVKNAVDRISSFPVGMEPAVVYKQENLGFAYSFAISGNVDLATLKRYGRLAEDELRSMEGISKVELSGFPDEEIEIAFRERDLRAYGLSFQEAAEAVRKSNVDLTGGSVKGKKEELLLRSRNKSYSAEGLRDIVVKTTPAGGVVRLHQVAEIRDRWADNPNRSFLNGKPSVVVTVQNTLEEDLLDITDKVRQYVDDFNARHEVVEAETIRDSSILLRQRIDLLTVNGVMGFMIVLFVLALFLNWRLAFWVALSIPISFAGMFLMAYLVGITINAISLFGMIIVVGILVDDGIVIGESIYSRFEEGDSSLKAASGGTLIVLPAVVAAVLTTIVAFSSFLFLDGRIGDFFSDMAVVVIFSLAFSLVEGIFVLPTHIAHSKALRLNQQPGLIRKWFDRLMYFLRDRTYAPVLRFTIHNKVIVVTSFVAVLAMSFGALSGGFVPSTFFPIIERDDLSITLQMPAGTREEVTMGLVKRLEEATWRANEELSEHYFNNQKQAIKQVEVKLGPTSYQATINIALLDGENRDSLRLREVVNTIRREAGPVEEAEIISFGSQTAFGKPVSISLVGNNYKELQLATQAVKDELRQLTELTDINDNNQEGLREINITLKDKARYLGLDVQTIIGQVRQGFFGAEAQRLQRGEDEVKVWVRYHEDDRRDWVDLADMRIRTLAGTFPLSEVAELSVGRGVISINHIDGKREVKVEADIANDDVSVSDLTINLKEEVLPKVLAGFPGVSALFEGQNREQEKSVSSMRRVGLVVLAAMFFIIALTFRDMGQTVVVFLLIPFSLAGVIGGHWLMDAPLSLFSFLGVIALIGILVNDALVLVSAYNDLLRAGHGQMDALYEAGVSRFRPILLTSLTTFAGLAPIMFEKSLQAQFLIPMAISVSYGLLMATLINLILMPALLVILNRLRLLGAYVSHGYTPAKELVEPARKEMEAEREMQDNLRHN